MKILIALFLCVASVSAQQFSNKLFILSFDYPTEELTNTTFRIHSSPSISIPLAAWSAMEPGWITESITNGFTTLASSNAVMATAPTHYFTVSASNEWGLVFSEVLATRPPRQNMKLRLR